MSAQPAEEHRLVAGRFGDLADRAGPGDWDAPAPVPGWTARDVVGHLVEWLPGFLGDDLGRELSEVDLTDPARAWRLRAAQVQALIENRPDEVFHQHRLGELKLAEAIDQYYTTDVFMHTWDLARALGIEPDLDQARAARLLAGMQPYEQLMRASGEYGPRIEVAPDATVPDRLVGFIGRDPAWRRPTRR
ncbi:MAG: maleylpyruvate isomerase family mycothiol-dependent enzyme [Micromonosporaceae bacterium]|nr:maleylpyruvate isomerase family mycothiol-dependent enzyme [Micromonosporaceae bacterium]